MRRLCTTLLTLAAASSLLAQGPATAGAPRLRDCIEAPYAYVTLDREGLDRAGDAVGKLLSDPSLDAIFGGAGEDGASGSSRSLAMVRSMLRRGASEIELAMTGIVAREGQPLLVLRARLQHDHADRLRLMLEQKAELAAPSRKVGEHQAYSLRAPDGSVRDGGPGEVVELAMVGDDLIAGNDGTALQEVLDPAPLRTSADNGGRRVLASDPRYQDLRGRLDAPAGSLLVYGDWRRLGRRLQSTVNGAPAQLLGSSGLGTAESVMMTISPSESGFSATLLLGFDRVERRPRGARPAGPGIDGWFAATEPMAAKELLRELPHGGLGGLVLSVDLTAVAAHSPRSSHLVWGLREAFDVFGLDFERNVLDRLAARGTVQLHFGADDGDGDAFAAVTPVYSVRAKSRRAAQDVFKDLRRVAEGNDLGKLVEDRAGRRRLDLLRLQGRRGEFTAWLCVREDSLLVAESRETLVQVHDELAKARPRGRRDQFAANAIKEIGGERVAGLFDLDLDPLFVRLQAALPGVDLTALPRRHVGYLDADQQGEGAVVRIRSLSSR